LKARSALLNIGRFCRGRNDFELPSLGSPEHRLWSLLSAGVSQKAMISSLLSRKVIGFRDCSQSTTIQTTAPGALNAKAKNAAHQGRQRHEIIPSELLFEKENREYNKDQDRDHLLDDLELKVRELEVPSDWRVRQTILDSALPRDETLSKRQSWRIEMPVPGEGHEDVRQHQ